MSFVILDSLPQTRNDIGLHIGDADFGFLGVFYQAEHRDDFRDTGFDAVIKGTNICDDLTKTRLPIGDMGFEIDNGLTAAFQLCGGESLFGLLGICSDEMAADNRNDGEKRKEKEIELHGRQYG